MATNTKPEAHNGGGDGGAKSQAKAKAKKEPKATKDVSDANPKGDHKSQAKGYPAPVMPPAPTLPLPALNWSEEAKRIWPLIRHIADMREALAYTGPTATATAAATAAATTAAAAADAKTTAPARAAAAASGAAVDVAAGLGAFSEVTRNDYVVFNYSMGQADTFPDPAHAPDPQTAVMWSRRREARGLICCAHSGRVLARRFHKFFNVNELDETDAAAVDAQLQRAITTAGGDVTDSHVVLDKFDGVFVSPIASGGAFVFATKTGAHNKQAQAAHRFALNAATAAAAASNAKAIDYFAFCSEWYSREYSCVFEWCDTRDKPLVVQYDTTLLVLTAIRHHITGEYVPYHAMAKAAAQSGIPVVQPRVRPTPPPSDPTTAAPTAPSVSVSELLSWISAEVGIEGVVLRLRDGQMWKLKSAWYVASGKGNADLLVQERGVWALICAGAADDLKATAATATRDDTARRVLARRIDAFTSTLLTALRATATRLADTALPRIELALRNAQCCVAASASTDSATAVLQLDPAARPEALKVMAIALPTVTAAATDSKAAPATATATTTAAASAAAAERAVLLRLLAERWALTPSEIAAAFGSAAAAAGSKANAKGKGQGKAKAKGDAAKAQPKAADGKADAKTDANPKAGAESATAATAAAVVAMSSSRAFDVVVEWLAEQCGSERTFQAARSIAGSAHFY